MIVIFNYGVGNILSIKNMVKKAGFDVEESSSYKHLKDATKIIFPGVGHFSNGMDKLRNSGNLSLLTERVINDKVPILGICLGAQIMANGSEEGGGNGLGWIDASVIRFNTDEMTEPLPVPNMGWCDVVPMKNSQLTADLPENSRYYFVHSYHIRCNSSEDVLLTASYGYEFVAGFNKDNIYGVQFHPEKSHKFGMRLLSNFCKL